ncbi:thioredoxin [Halolamina litorea]|uniref:Thioredoxin n=1 Tax=Halolamina litorea TaxID=1515593 RepID=A0ABD6BP26_9EURY|nr:thioredoxin [Halolamina litorea]
MAEDLDEIREKKLEDLKAKQSGDGAGTPTSPIHIDGAGDLQSTADEHGVVLVDFYADWCGPCQMLEPVVETIAEETDAAVAKVDVDANQQLAAEYGVRGVPTLILFADGEPVERLVGMQNESQLRSLIASHTGA